MIAKAHPLRGRLRPRLTLKEPLRRIPLRHSSTETLTETFKLGDRRRPSTKSWFSPASPPPATSTVIRRIERRQPVALHNIHVHSDRSDGLFLPYYFADAYQEKLRSEFFAWKDVTKNVRGAAQIPKQAETEATSQMDLDKELEVMIQEQLVLEQQGQGLKTIEEKEGGIQDTPKPDPSLPPLPKILSFVTPPTFTLGRRMGTDARQAYAGIQRSNKTSPLASTLYIPGCWCQLRDRHSALLYRVRKGRNSGTLGHIRPMVLPTNRGGLTTYHGPGQLVIWPMIDLQSPLHRHLTVKCYARLLEETTQAVLKAKFGLVTHLDDAEPGVWAGLPSDIAPGATLSFAERRARPIGAPMTVAKRKLAALGVHVRRHVTGLGIAINLDVPIVGDFYVNPWSRFVPCGLHDRQVTNVAAEMGLNIDPRSMMYQGFPLSGNLHDLALIWAKAFARRLGLGGVQQELLSPYDVVERAPLAEPPRSLEYHPMLGPKE